jgi:hypothetical protein
LRIRSLHYLYLPGKGKILSGIACGAAQAVLAQRAIAGAQRQVATLVVA